MSENPSPETQLSLVQLAALQSVMNAEVANVSVACSRYSLPVSRRLLRSSGRRRPLFLVKRTCSSSHELGSASEHVTRSKPVTLPKKRNNLPWSFSPHRDIRALGPLTGKVPDLPMFRPQRFSRSRRVTPQRTLRAYFISLPRAGFTFQGFSLLPSRTISSMARALMTSLVHFLSMSKPTNTRAARSPPRP